MHIGREVMDFNGERMVASEADTSIIESALPINSQTDMGQIVMNCNDLGSGTLESLCMLVGKPY